MSKTSLLSLCFVLMLASCSKSGENNILEPQATDYVQFKQMIPSVQKSAYQTLTSKEKSQFWKSHVKEVANNLNLSLNQKTFIKRTFALLNSSFFEENLE